MAQFLTKTEPFFVRELVTHQLSIINHRGTQGTEKTLSNISRLL